MLDIKKMLDSCPPPQPIEMPVLIYGAGNTGKIVCGYMKKQGLDVHGFVDISACEGQYIEDMPVYKPGKWPAGFMPKNYCVIVAIHNRDVCIHDIMEVLKGWGFHRVVSMIDFTNLFSHDQPSRFWMAPRSYYHEHGDEIFAMLKLIDDAESLMHVEQILTFRISGDYGVLALPAADEQYLPSDLPRWKEPLRLVDCGAYQGEFITELRKKNYRIEDVVTFEPDLENYKKIPGLHSECQEMFNFPCGVFSANEMLRFNSGQGEASHLSETGNSFVLCVTLDNAIPNFRPSLIKMDIEGAECAALKGAQNLISTYKPDLAISLYHRPEDIWEIPLLIDRMGLGYKFHVRSHAYNSFESVLYAVQL